MSCFKELQREHSLTWKGKNTQLMSGQSGLLFDSVQVVGFPGFIETKVK